MNKKTVIAIGTAAVVVIAAVTGLIYVNRNKTPQEDKENKVTQADKENEGNPADKEDPENQAEQKTPENQEQSEDQTAQGEQQEYAYSKFYPMYEADFMMHGTAGSNIGVYETSKADKTTVTLGSTGSRLVVAFENVILTNLESITICYGPEYESRLEIYADCAVDTAALGTLGKVGRNKNTSQPLPIEFDVDDYPYYEEGITGGVLLAEYALVAGKNTDRRLQTEEVQTELTGVHNLFVVFPVGVWSGHFDGITLNYKEDVSAQIEEARSLPRLAFEVESGSAYDYYKDLLTDNVPVITEYISDNGFLHPGIGLTKSILDNMVVHVRAGDEPWATAFLQFSNLSKCTRDNAPRAANQLNSGTQHRIAADIAFHQVLMYLITGDTVYAENARTTLLSFGEIDKMSNDIITESIAVYKICMSADIMANVSGSAWTEEDTRTIQEYVARDYVKKQYNNYDAFMNQYVMGVDAYIASAIFRNDPVDYAIGVQRLTTNPEAGGTLGRSGAENAVINRSGDIRSQFRAVTLNAETGEELDGSHVQLVEMGRDQAHAFGDVGGIGVAALMLLAQGTLVDNETGLITTEEDGVNAFEFLNRRILAAANYICKYNLGYDVTYIPIYVGALEIYYYPNYYTSKHNNTSVDERRLEACLGAVYYYYYYLAEFEEGFDFKTDESTRYLYEAYHKEGFAPEGDSMDWLGNGVLLFTQEEDKEN